MLPSRGNSRTWIIWLANTSRTSTRRNMWVLPVHAEGHPDRKQLCRQGLTDPSGTKGRNVPLPLTRLKVS